MTAFAEAVDVIFADPNMALDALYTPKGASEGSSVRVLRRAPDSEVGFAEARVVTDAATFQVRVAEVPLPGRGDRIEIADEVFLVQGAPRRDSERLTWTFEADPQYP